MSLPIEKDTIIRTVLLIVALINQILTSTGHAILPFSDEQITDCVSLALTIGASAWAWWKNNSFTMKARKADKIMKEMGK